MNNTTNLLSVILKNDENIIMNSQFYKEYLEFSSDYHKLIKDGIVNKRQSQMRSILDYNHLNDYNLN